MIKKRYDAQFKVLRDEKGAPTGEVEFYASVFGNVDLIGDRVMPGAFTKSLKKWQDSGNPIPIVFAHTWDDPFSVIGFADAAKCYEDEIGLKIVGQLDIETNPTARQVHSLMARNILKEASFAFDVGDEKRAKDGANNLNILDILEVGPCLKGMNPLAGRPSVKERRVKEALSGSVEETQGALQVAAAQALGTDDNSTWVYIRGTYPDHIVACVSGPGVEETHYSIDYTTDANGDVTLGTPVEVEIESEVVPIGAKKFAWTDPDGAGHIPIDDAGQVRAALNLAQNDWTFRGNRMSPAPPADEQDAVVGRIVAAADKFGIDTDLGKKAGARNSRADSERIQAMHDTAVGLGAACDPREDGDTTATPEDFGTAGEDGAHMDTKDVKVEDAEGVKAEASDGEDDVDADRDDDAGKPVEPEHEEKSEDAPAAPNEKSADEDAAAEDKAEEPDGVKAEDPSHRSAIALAELLEIEASLL